MGLKRWGEDKVVECILFEAFSQWTRTAANAQESNHTKCQCGQASCLFSQKCISVAVVCTGLNYMIMNIGGTLKTTMDLNGGGQ